MMSPFGMKDKDIVGEIGVREMPKFVSSCRSCEDGTFSRASQPLNPHKADKAAIVLFDRPQYITTAEGKLDAETLLLASLVERATKVNIKDSFCWLPIVRCSLPKIKPTYFRNCARFREPFLKNKKIIAFGKEVMRWVFYEGVTPPDMWVLHGRVVRRGKQEVLPLIGPELIETHREWPDRLEELIQQYVAESEKASDVLRHWKT